jgi:hypothetical protein
MKPARADGVLRGGEILGSPPPVEHASPHEARIRGVYSRRLLISHSLGSAARPLVVLVVADPSSSRFG